MRARQSRRRIAAAVGLLAMLLQLCVSLGHVHAGDLARPMSLQAGACATPSDCSRHIPPGLPDDNCPICAAIHMAATGVPPTAPTIAIPQNSSRAFIVLSLSHFIAPPGATPRSRPARRHSPERFLRQ